MIKAIKYINQQKNIWLKINTLSKKYVGKQKELYKRNYKKNKIKLNI